MSEAMESSAPVEAPSEVSEASEAPAEAVESTGAAEGGPAEAASDAGSVAGKSAEELFELKFGDQVEKVDLAELRRRAQLSMGAEQRLREAREMQRRAEAVQQQLSDPAHRKHFLEQQLGGRDQLLGFAQQLLQEEIRLQSMTPEARALAQQKADLDRQRREFYAAQRQALEAQQAQQTKAAQERFRQEFGEALTTAKVPVSQLTIAEMARAASKAHQLGIPFDAAHAAKEIKAALGGAYGELLGGFGEDTSSLLDFLGADRAKQIADAYAAKLRPKVAQSPEATPAPKAASLPAPKKEESWDDYWSKLT